MTMAQLTETTPERPRIAANVQTSDLDRFALHKPVESVTPKKRPRSLSRWIALAAFAVVTALVLTAWWLQVRRFESTDDAQIEGHLHSVSSRISGTVAYIHPKIENNQYVEAGTLL